MKKYDGLRSPKRTFDATNHMTERDLANKTNSYIDALVSVFERFVNIINRSSGVRIKRSESTAYTDFQDIYINYSELISQIKSVYTGHMSELALLTMVRGIICHELSHLLYTPTNGWRTLLNTIPKIHVSQLSKTSYKELGMEEHSLSLNRIVDGTRLSGPTMDLTRQAMNILEDQRVEMLFTRAYPSAVSYFEYVVNNYVLDKSKARKFNPDTYLLVCGRKYLDSDMRAEMRKHAEGFIATHIVNSKDLEMALSLLGILEDITDAWTMTHELSYLDKFKPTGASYGTEPLYPFPELIKPARLVALYVVCHLMLSDLVNDRVQQNVRNDMLNKWLDADKFVIHSNNMDMDSDEIDKMNDIVDDVADKIEQDKESRKEQQDEEDHAKGILEDRDAIDAGSEGYSIPGDVQGKRRAWATETQAKQDEILKKIVDKAEARQPEIAEKVSQEVKDTTSSIRSAMSSGAGFGGAAVKSLRRIAIDSDMRHLAKRASKTFANIQADLDDYWEHRTQQGRVVARRYALRQPWDLSIFDQYVPDQHQEGGVEMAILVDFSSSMQKEAEVVSKMLWILGTAMEKLDIPRTIIGYNSDVIPLLDRKTKLPRDKYDYYNPMGGTDPYEALLLARRVLQTSSMGHKVVLNLTDGSWGYLSRSDKLIEELNRDGYVTALFGLQNAVGQFGDHSHQISGDIDNPMEMIGIATKIVKQIQENQLKKGN